MPEFYLTDDEIQRLQLKFQEFKRDREKVHELLNDYVADYRQFDGTSAGRYEHLQRKFISKSPALSHLISIDGSFLWSVNDIAIILGRHRTTIQRSLDKLEKSEGWCVKLLALRETSKAPSGLKIYVYHQEIFDLILDLYEEEYLLRFSEPRRGNIENAPDINEVRRFWSYLKDLDSANELAIRNMEKVLPDIPPMNLKDILALIWDKIFNIRIGTACSVVFAVCFEIAKRFFSVNLWPAIVSAVITLICVTLIYRRKFSPDTLSNFGAGALLFMMLWISAVLSLPNDGAEYKNVKRNIILTPVRSDNHRIFFNITHNIPNVKEFLYCISPDIIFHSTGFLNQFNPDNNLPYPALSISNSQTEGITDIDVKFIDDKDVESPVWHFSFDISFERFKLNKNFILNLNNYSWVSASQYKDLSTNEIITEVSIIPFLFSGEIRSAIKHLFYGINTKQPDIEVDFDNLNDYDPYVLFSTKEDDISFVSSQIIFVDGSYSDIRIDELLGLSHKVTGN